MTHHASPDQSSYAGPASQDFLSLLRHSGVLSRRQFEQVCAKVRAGRYPREASALATRLVRKGLLTEYQARRIVHGRTDGLVIGRYVILDRLGKGAMGRVYKARHRLMGRIVALKVIAPEIASRPRAVGRFRREMQLIGRLDHPNIIRAFDADHVGNRPYLVMEYVIGEGLDQRLQARGPLPEAEVIDHAAQAALGLAHAHGQGVIHRDLKPSNLIVDAEGRLKVLDFGLGALTGLRADDAEDFQSADGCIVGSIDYMSPEQAAGRDLDGRSDLYSLGCVMYRLLTGQVPFPAADPISGMVRRMADGSRPAPLTDLRPDLPPGLVAVVERLMAPRPEDRYQTAAEAAEALRHLTPAAPEPARDQPAPSRRSRPAAADAITIPGLVLTAAPVPPTPAGIPVDPASSGARRTAHGLQSRAKKLVLAAAALMGVFSLATRSALLGR